MAASGKVDVTGTPAAAKEAKPVHTVRFQEGVEGHLEAKARGDRSRLYFKDGKPHVHSPHKLLEGTVVYRCKILGSMIVAQSQGTNLIREVVDRLQLVGEVRKGAKVVDLGINTRSLYIKDVERKAILINHPLHQISYCAADRRYDNIFAYIIKHAKKDKPTICYVYETMDAEASEIAATVGQAFQLAYNRFQDAKAAQLGFRDMKDKLISDLDKLEFSKQVTELQKQVQEMEAEADAKDRRHRPETTEKFPEVEPEWDSITNALDLYNTKPPDTQCMVPRPETAELDGVIQNIEEQLGELQEAFSDQWFLLERLTAREREAELAKNVMEGIDGQVQDMLADAEKLPEHYQTRAFQRAKEKASLPEIGLVKNKTSQWEQKTKKK